MDNAKLKDLADILAVKSEENRKLFENLGHSATEALRKSFKKIEALGKSFENIQINNIQWPIMPSLTKNLRYRCHCQPSPESSSTSGSDNNSANRKIGFQPPNI